MRSAHVWNLNSERWIPLVVNEHKEQKDSTPIYEISIKPTSIPGFLKVNSHTVYLIRSDFGSAAARLGSNRDHVIVANCESRMIHLTRLRHGNISWVSRLRHCSGKPSTRVTTNFPLFQRARRLDLCVFTLSSVTSHPCRLKCHTVASTSPPTGGWPPGMAIRSGHWDQRISPFLFVQFFLMWIQMSPQFCVKPVWRNKNQTNTTEWVDVCSMWRAQPQRISL